GRDPRRQVTNLFSERHSEDAQSAFFLGGRIGRIGVIRCCANSAASPDDSFSNAPPLHSSTTPLQGCLVKIAVVGPGAVGSFYGAKLARAGQEVHFLLRSDYEAVRRNGVLIRSPQGD